MYFSLCASHFDTLSVQLLELWADPANIDSVSNVGSVDFIAQSSDFSDPNPGEQIFTKQYDDTKSVSEGNVDAVDLLDIRDSLANK